MLKQYSALEIDASLFWNAVIAMIRAVLFDMDGTLIYNRTDFMKMRECTVNRLADLGIPPSILDKDRIIVSNLAAAEKYAAENGIDISLLYAETGKVMSRIEMESAELAEPIEGVLETIIELKNESYRTGVLTRGSRKYAEAALKKAGLDIGYDAFICRDDYPEEEAKPAPAAMYRAAAAMRTETAECLYLGDHLIDMQCALSAGAQFAGVLTGAYSAEDWEKAGARYIPSVASLPEILPL